jgi:hypothetical protein
VVCVSQGKGDGRSIANDATSDRGWRILCAGGSGCGGFASRQLKLQLLESATVIPLVRGLSRLIETDRWELGRKEGREKSGREWPEEDRVRDMMHVDI